MRRARVLLAVLPVRKISNACCNSYPVMVYSELFHGEEMITKIPSEVILTRIS